MLTFNIGKIIFKTRSTANRGDERALSENQNVEHLFTRGISSIIGDEKVSFYANFDNHSNSISIPVNRGRE